MALKRGTSRVALPGCLVAAALAALVLSVYWQVGTHDFVNMDDDVFIYENPVVLKGLTPEGAAWAFTAGMDAGFIPLTWISRMTDVSLFGTDAGWHHRVNVLLHAANAALLFFLLQSMTGAAWRSALAAALFAVHPLHVESVAWVTERKDVLSTLFWLLTTASYLRYARRPAAGRFAAVLLFFALGLLSKPMLVTLPLTLLLLDYWPLGRLSPAGGRADAAAGTPSRPGLARLAREKLVLLAMSAAAAAATWVYVGRVGVLASWERVPFGLRAGNAVVSYAAYLGKTAWPASLSPIYPYPEAPGGIPTWAVAGAFLALAVVSLAAWRSRAVRPWITLGWLWYLGTLFPVIGVVQAGPQAMADRYTYVPLIGIFIAVSWSVPALSRRGARLAVAALAVASILALSAAARVQAGYWRDGVTLFSHAVAATGESNWFALNNLGMSLGRLGRHGEAVGCFERAVRINPLYAKAWYNLGVSRGRLGEFQEAAGDFRKAVRIDRDYGKAWYNLGICCERLGRFPEAADAFREAVRLDPADAEARNSLAEAEKRAGRLEPAPGFEPGTP